MGKRARSAADPPALAASTLEPSGPSDGDHNNTASTSADLAPQSHASTSADAEAERAAKKARKREKQLKRMMQQMDEPSATEGGDADTAADMQVEQEASQPVEQVEPKKKSKKEAKRKDVEPGIDVTSATTAAVQALRGADDETSPEPSKKKQKKKDKQKIKESEQSEQTNDASAIDAIDVGEPSTSTKTSKRRDKRAAASQHAHVTSLPVVSSSHSHEVADSDIDPSLNSTSVAVAPSQMAANRDQAHYMIDPLFNFDFIPTASHVDAAEVVDRAEASTSSSDTPDIQVVQHQQHVPHPRPQEYDLPVASSAFASTSYGTGAIGASGAVSNSEDIPVLGPEGSVVADRHDGPVAPQVVDAEIDANGGDGIDDGAPAKKKSKKDKSATKEKKVKKKDKHKTSAKDKEANVIGAIAGSGSGAPGEQVPSSGVPRHVDEMQIDPQLVELGPPRANLDGVRDQPGRAKSKDKGKGRAVPEQHAAAGSSGEHQGEAALNRKKGKSKDAGSMSISAPATGQPSGSTSTMVSPPRPIRVGPIRAITDPLFPKTVFDPTDDSSVLSVEELEQDPEFVKPELRIGPFWDVLQTKWTPVKELKHLADEHGQTYKQGKFTTSEDRLIKATIKSFRERSGLSSEELVNHINSRRGAHPNATKGASSAAVPIGGGPKKSNAAGGAGGGGAGAVSGYGGPLSDMWQELGYALQERALLSIWNRVKRMYNPDSGKGPWTPDEDESLRRAVKEFGSSSWEKIGPAVGRPSGDCRDRWVKQLGGGKLEIVRKGKWTAEEEQMLIDLHRELGNSWTAIVKRMGGTRSATQCRIKWSDSLSRKVQQNATETPEPQASTSASGAADEGESKDTENTDSKAWKWKHEYYSTLVHLVADMHVKNESEIDFAAIDDPTLQVQGVKNLRDRFKRLRQGAITDLREQDKLDPEAKIPYQAVIDHLLALYPEPGKAYKRTYRASEQKRLDREREKELRKVQKVEKARLKREQRDQDGSAIPHRRKVKSQPIVDESDDSAESSSSSSEDEDESDKPLFRTTRSHHHKVEASIHSKPNPIPMKKSGHGTANWGAANDEILEGVDLARSGEFRLPHSPEMMGAQKLAISPSIEKEEREVAPLA